MGRNLALPIWKARKAGFAYKLPPEIVREVVKKLSALIPE
jgi:hypothetical protein